MKNKIIFTRGVSASGKTVWTEQFVKDNPNYVNINRDDIRAALFCNGELDWSRYKFTRGNEKRVTEVQEQLIYDAVVDGKSIIISDTNLHDKYIGRILTSQGTLLDNYEVEYKWFEIDLLEALKRDARRSNGVGYEVITKQYKLFSELFYGADWHTFSDDKEDAMIIDVDGTIAQMDGRSPFEWDKVDTDLPRTEIIYMVKGLIDRGYTPIFLSGRDSCCTDKTQTWIEEQFPELEGHFHLYMRSEGDTRKDTIIKKELFDKYIDHKYNVRVVLDDRPSVSRMFQYKLGLNVVNVGNPWVEF